MNILSFSHILAMSKSWTVIFPHGLCVFENPGHFVSGGGGGGGGGVMFSWLSSEPRNIYPQIINSDLVPCPPATNRAH